MKITDRLNGKKILIWGYGREGKSSERFLDRYCKPASVDVFEGKAEDIDESRYDLILKSPGIHVERYSEKYTSQTELFLGEFRDRTVGITGTKGKSTTSSLLYHVLSACLGGDRVVLMGNIGLPCLDYYEAMQRPDTVAVFEMSCHQLADNPWSPHVAIFLNLYEDHLDYYGTRENYFATKKNITAHQTASDYFYYGDEVPPVETKARKKRISMQDPQTFELQLKGAHNQFNARFVYAVATELFGCADADVRAALAGFSGLKHRMEFVANVNGVAYYNDSISTIPEATIRAVGSIPNTKTVIIGGMDRHISYDKLIEFIRAHGEYVYILSYASGKRIYDEVSALPNCRYAEDLSGAVALARQLTPAGGACVFSPAAASYGYFKDFEARGEAYRALVLRQNEA